jgi:hypothetical protein
LRTNEEYGHTLVKFGQLIVTSGFNLGPVIGASFGDTTLASPGCDERRRGHAIDSVLFNCRDSEAPRIEVRSVGCAAMLRRCPRHVPFAIGHNQVDQRLSWLNQAMRGRDMYLEHRLRLRPFSWRRTARRTGHTAWKVCLSAVRTTFVDKMIASGIERHRQTV